MKAKRILSFTLAMLMAIAMGGCNSGSQDPAPAQSEQPTQSAQAEQSTETQDTPAAPDSDTNRVDVVTLGMVSSPDTLHPYNISGNYGDVVFDMIFDRMIDFHADGEIIPRLATSWDSDIADDGTMTMTFHLDPNAKWHDGTPLTAHDVVFTAQIVTNPEITTNRRYYWASLAGTDDSGACEDPSTLGIEALDDHTVQYTFKQVVAPDAYLYIEGRFQYIMPKHLLENIEPAELHKSDYFQNPVGSGPLIFDSMVEGERYEMVANPDYFRGLVNMDRVVVRIMQAANLTPSLISGEIDACIGHTLGNIPLEDWDFISSQDGIIAKSVPAFGYQYMTINHQKDYFKDPRIRMAISMAINRKNIVDQLLQGHGLIGVSSLPNTHPFFNPEIGEDPYNPDEARKLLEEAGWDFDRVIDFAVPTGNIVREKSAVLIQQDLKAIGVKTELRVMDFTTEIVELREGKTDFGLLGGGGSVDPDDVRINFFIEGSNNFSMLPTSELYDLMDNARTLQTREERVEAYNEWQLRCYEDTPFVWLYHANSLVAYNDRFDYYPVDDFIMINWLVMEWTFK